MEPVANVFRQLRPFGDAVESRFSDLRDKVMAQDAPVTGGGGNASPAASATDALAVDATRNPATKTAAIGTDPGPVDQTVAGMVADCMPDGGIADVVVLGDRLTLRVFEQSALAPLPAEQATTDRERVIFERLDLSGSYEIGPSGSVSLPAIGHVDIIGQRLDCAETLIGRTISERLRVNASVSAGFASRPPVLVSGVVRTPGAHAYAPGLTVERVLAQAGAIQQFDPPSPQQVATLSAREGELSMQDASLIIERARFDAVLDGDYELAKDDSKWTSVADALGTERVVFERALLMAQLDEQAEESSRINRRTADLESRIAAARESLEAAESQLVYLEEREAIRVDFLSRRLSNNANVDEATLRRMDMSRVVLDKRDALAALEGELHMVQHDRTLHDASHRLQIATFMVETSKARAAIAGELRTVRQQLDVGDDIPEQSFVVTIERPTLSGTAKFAASFDTVVRPGDLVAVKSADTRAVQREVPTAFTGLDQPETLITAAAQ
jgi:protein involved in polysaccharide export with SLBB domain